MKNILSAVIIVIKNNLQYNDVKDTINRVKQIRPELSDYDIIAGINIARRIMFREDYMTEEIKREIDMWERSD